MSVNYPTGGLVVTLCPTSASQSHQDARIWVARRCRRPFRRSREGLAEHDFPAKVTETVADKARDAVRKK